MSFILRLVRIMMEKVMTPPQTPRFASSLPVDGEGWGGVLDKYRSVSRHLNIQALGNRVGHRPPPTSAEREFCVGDGLRPSRKIGTFVISRQVLSLLALFLLLALPVWAQTDAPDDADGTAEPEIPENVEIITGDVSLFIVFEYAVELAADEAVTIIARAASTNVNPALSLLDEAGEVVAEGVSGEITIPGLDTYDAQIVSFTPQADAGFIIRVTNDFFSIGQVEVIIVRGELEAPEGEAGEDGGEPLGFLQRDLPVITEGSDLVLLPRRRTTGTCTARGNGVTARLRNAPNTVDSRVVRQLGPFEELPVDGFYEREDGDGYRWYRISGYLWAREDVVFIQGDCRAILIL